MIRLLPQSTMMKHISIKFIALVSIVVLTLIAINAAVFLLIANQAQTKQAERFLQQLRTERELEAQLLRDNLLRKGQSFAIFIARNAYKYLSNFDYEYLEKMSTEAEQDPDILFVEFRDTEGGYFYNGEQHHTGAHITQEIAFGDDLIGFVEIGLNVSSVDQTTASVSERIDTVIRETIEAQSVSFRELIRIILVSAVIEVFVLCLVIYLVLSRIIVTPLKHVTSIARAIANGELEHHIDIHSVDEIGTLATAFQTMRESIQLLITDMQVALDLVASSSQELSSNAEQMYQGASKQAATAEEVSATMEHMAANIRQNADNALRTEKIAVSAAEKVHTGKKAVAESVLAMQKIAEKVAVIEDIAHQTNILSLNASIEAAKAEGYGKGFAVVAAEVRSLAGRSQEASEDIYDLVSSGVTISETASKLLNRLAPDIQKTAELVQEISAASSEQHTRAELINLSIQQLDGVVQQNSAISEELSVTAQKLANQAKRVSSQKMMVNVRI